MFKLESLGKRLLEAVIEIENEQEGGEFKKEDFRIFFWDLSRAEEKELNKRASEAYAKAYADYAESYQKLNTQVEEAAAEQKKLAKDKKNQKKIDALTKKIEAWTNELAELPIPPTWEMMYLAEKVDSMPDVIDKDGSIPPVSPKLFEFLSPNFCLVIRDAIQKRTNTVEDKKK